MEMKSLKIEREAFFPPLSLPRIFENPLNRNLGTLPAFEVQVFGHGFLKCIMEPWENGSFLCYPKFGVFQKALFVTQPIPGLSMQRPFPDKTSIILGMDYN